MDEVEHALASVALADQGQDAAPPEPAARSTGSPPVLPYELIADIIELTVESLVEQERNLPSQIPLTNEFLLSAALVNHTWHSIVTSAILKSGLIQPGSVHGFIEQAEKNGVRETLDRVRFGAGAKGPATDNSIPPDEGADDEPFQLLVSSLPSLTNLELFGRGLRFENALSHPYNILSCTLSNTSFSDIWTLAQKLAAAPPAHLSIIERPRPTDTFPESLWPFLDFALKIQTLHMCATGQTLTHMHYYSIFALGADGAPCLRNLRLDFAHDGEEVDVAHWNMFWDSVNGLARSRFVSFPALERLATHILPLHFFATWGTAGRPSLTSLEVLPDDRQIDEEKAESKLLELVQKLPVLRDLKVPTCWRSDAVEDACEAKGVDLRWT
ncbi:hypothetical protein RQP46_006081 [Phenoliferia psychrophenolica]